MQIELRKQPQKYLRQVDAKTRARLQAGIANIASGTGDITRLAGTVNQYRYKINHYRILFQAREEGGEKIITITDINTRTNIKY